jgi:hypothetical protein
VTVVEFEATLKPSEIGSRIRSTDCHGVEPEEDRVAYRWNRELSLSERELRGADARPTPRARPYVNPAHGRSRKPGWVSVAWIQSQTQTYP